MAGEPVMTYRMLIVAIVAVAISVTPQMVFASSVPSAGSLAPEFTLASQEGTRVSLKDYRGKKRVYIPGGEGYISVFQQNDADHYKLLAKAIPLWAHVLLGTSERAGKDLIASTLPSRPAPIMAPKCGSIRYRTSATEGLVDPVLDVRAASRPAA